MKTLLASLLAALFALAALSAFAAAPIASGMGAEPQNSLPADEDKDKDKEPDGGKKSD
ncbi:MAG: hypothetical protein ACREUN_08720 [Burkholderiales bacterium]